jgi:VWFA-related protein
MGVTKGRITTPRSRAATLVTAGVLLALPTPGHAAGQPPPAPAGPAETRVEVVAVGRDGRCVETLDPQDISVTIDGSPRQVLYVRRVSRGPGAAADAARRLRAAGPGWQFAAEPVRRVLVIVDQASIVRGTEATVVQAGRAFLDRLGIGDRAAVVRVPLDSDLQIELATDRPAAREALGLVRGLLAPLTQARGDPLAASAERPAMSDPGRLSESQPASQGAAPARMATGPLPAGAASASLAAVAKILQSLESTPGRKVVALFSRGFGAAPAQGVAETSAAAIAAGATVYGIQLPMPQNDWETRRGDTVTLEALAVSTGGSFAVLGRTPERIFDGVIEAMSAVQVIGLAPRPGDLDGTRRAIRVESRRAGLTVQTPAWLLPSPDRGDQQPAVETGPPAAAAERSTGDRRVDPPEAAAPAGPDRNPELALALDRVFEYVQAYEAEYSALVAEEHYEQFAGRQYVRLRSDFLLVNQESTEGWVCFRDVFEVDGKPVRDREDRLQRLFLEPSPDVWARLVRIKGESARYNIGSVDRNINLPLFALQFLRAEHRTRFRFKLAGRPESGGVRTWRIEFTETARPTIIRDPEDRDVPASGWFLVEQGTGAVVETVLRVANRATSTEIVATFRRSPDLGMWVPSEMRETHRTTRLPASSRESVLLQGRAKYENFRRFQVHTDVVLAIKK